MAAFGSPDHERGCPCHGCIGDERAPLWERALFTFLSSAFLWLLLLGAIRWFASLYWTP